MLERLSLSQFNLNCNFHYSKYFLNIGSLLHISTFYILASKISALLCGIDLIFPLCWKFTFIFYHITNRTSLTPLIYEVSIAVYLPLVFFDGEAIWKMEMCQIFIENVNGNNNLQFHFSSVCFGEQKFHYYIEEW